MKMLPGQKNGKQQKNEPVLYKLDINFMDPMRPADIVLLEKINKKEPKPVIQIKIYCVCVKLNTPHERCFWDHWLGIDKEDHVVFNLNFQRDYAEIDPNMIEMFVIPKIKTAVRDRYQAAYPQGIIIHVMLLAGLEAYDKVIELDYNTQK